MIAAGAFNLLSGTAYVLCLATGRTGLLSITVIPTVVEQVVYIAWWGLATVGSVVGLMLVIAVLEFAAA